MKLTFVNRAVRAFEMTVFGSYTGTPAARREFTRQCLAGYGFSAEAIERTMRDEDARKARQGESW